MVTLGPQVQMFAPALDQLRAYQCLPLPWISFDAFLTQGLSMQIVAAAMDQVRLLIAHVC